MDVRVVGAIVILIVCGHVISQENHTQATNNSNVASDSTKVSKECLTAKNVSGLCVQRQGCDYSTGAIDLTLYATRGYTRPCATDEVCCPQFAMAHVETNTSPSIDSDEDDF